MNVRDKLDWRYDFLTQATHFTLAERLSFITPRLGVGSLRDLLEKRLARTDEGLPYFAVGDEKVFFLREEDGEDEGAAREGALVVLAEAFGGSSDFFSPPVEIAAGDVVLDLGGNIGTSALQFARGAEPEQGSYSFEADFPCASRPGPRVRGAATHCPRPSAGGRSNSRGSGQSFRGPEIRGSIARLRGRASGPATARRAYDHGDVFVEERGLAQVDFIKCDIEGAEELAIRGAEKTIERFRPKWTISSYHTDPSGDAQHPKLVSLLTELGYTVRTVGGHHIYAH